MNGAPVPDYPSAPPRLAPIAPADLGADQRAVYDAIASGPRASGRQQFSLTDPDGALRGPFNAMLLSPPLGDALQSLGAAVRYRSCLSGTEREIAILAVAAHWHSAFEWASHAAVGTAEGLSAQQLRAIADGDRLPTGTDREHAVLGTARELLGSGSLGEAGLERARAALGIRIVYEITVLVGYYSTLALQLRVFGGEHPQPDRRPETTEVASDGPDSAAPGADRDDRHG